MLDSNKLGGFECPVCKGFIPVRIEELVVSLQVSCPSWGLLLTLDKNNSGKALGLIDNVLKNKKYG